MSLLIGTAAGAFSFDGELRPLIEGTRINHLVRDGDDWWAADGKGRIHRNATIAATMPEGAAALCLQPSRGVIWVGASQGRLYELSGSELNEDEFFADAPGRERWYTPWGDPADVRSMALDADHTLYINVHVGGVLRYDNTGLVPVVEIEADVHQVAAHHSRKGHVYAATAMGVATSHNGHDFEFFTGGLHASYCRAILPVESMVLVSASTGSRTSRGRLYRASGDGGVFEALTKGLPDWFGGNVNTHCLAMVGDRVYAGFNDTVWVSDDGGDFWSELITGLPKLTCLN